MPPQAEAHGADDGIRRRKPEMQDAAVSKKAFSWKEVAKHNTAESAWVIVNGKVYDLTSWVDNHPGGREMLLLMVGRDATAAFESYHPFTDKPRQLLGKFEIGTVCDFEFPQYPRDTGFYKELSKRVGNYFAENKIDYKSPWPGVWRMMIVFALAAVAFLVTNGFWVGVPMWARVIAASLFGVLQALPLLHMMHDSSHTAFGRTQAWWTFGGRLAMDVYAGANLTSWHYQHVVGHHIYTNLYLADPDLPVMEKGDARRLVSRQAYLPMYRFQHIYLPPLYGILGLKFRIQDFTETFFGERNGPMRVNPLGLYRWTEMWLTKALWACWRIGVPLMYFPDINVPQFLVLFLISEWMTGYYLAFNFQVSHVSTACDYPLGDKKADVVADEWAVSQCKTSVDYSHGSWLTAFLSGALNYQVTHHLFPGVSQYQYPAIAPIIMEVCKEYKVTYNHLPTFYEAFAAHIAHLRNLGIRGESGHEIHMG